MNKAPIPSKVFILSDGQDNILQGTYPDRFYTEVNRLELHYYQAANAKAQALVYAGGGYTSLMHDKEGVEIALWLVTLGIDAYVVTHRFPGAMIKEGKYYPSDIALHDGLACLDFLNERSTLPLLHVGLSSGGHLAGVMACQEQYSPKGAIITYAPVNANHRKYKAPANKPDYSPIQKQDFYDDWAIGLETEKHGIPSIPIFLAYPLHDEAVPIDHALNFIKTMHRVNGDIEAHIYPQAPHGFALRDKNGTHAHWYKLAERWIDRILAI